MLCQRHNIDSLCVCAANALANRPPTIGDNQNAVQVVCSNWFSVISAMVRSSQGQVSVHILYPSSRSDFPCPIPIAWD